MQILFERRQRMLIELAAKSTESLTIEQACQQALAVLADHPADVPFASLYLLTDDGQQANLVDVAGIAQAAFSGPKQILFAQQGEMASGPLAQVNRTRQALLVEDLHPLLGDASLMVGEQPLQSAYVLPIPHPAQAHLAGLLVLGITPYRAFDDGHQDFFHLIANQITAALTNAQAHEEAQARAEHLAALDRAKTSFFSNISHEFRTPLTLLLGPLEDLLSDSPETRGLQTSVHERLSLAHRNAQRLLKLVNTLLDFSRIEAGRIQAVYVPTDLSALTRDLASVFRSAIEQAGLRLLVDCPPLSEAVYVDTDMWEKIVLNLLSNAFKFTFEGEVSVSLLQVGEQVELVVRDSGIGISQEELPHLFERFHRVQGAHARTHEGSGIGLALVSDLVRLHGGSIAVTSTEGQGSSFTVTIPTGLAHLPAEQVQRASPAQGTSRTRTAYVEEVLNWLPTAYRGEETVVGPPVRNDDIGHNGKEEEKLPLAHILLAEDNADMRDYLAFLLRNAGYTVEAVENGRAALASLQRRVPALLLSDVMMPELDGLQLLQQVRAEPRTQRLPVLLLSARAGEEAAIEGLALGTDDYVMKPFSARELLARVRANVELGRMREEAVRQAQQHSVRLQGLYESLLAVHSTLSPEQVLELLSMQARDLLGASYALTSFTSDEKWAQGLVSTSWEPTEQVAYAPALPPSKDAQRRQKLQRQLEPLRERYVHLLRQPTASPYWLEAPLLERDGTEIGLVQVTSTAEGAFSHEDRLVLLQLVQMTSIALENAHSFQQAQNALAKQKEQEAFTILLLSFLAQELYSPLSAYIRHLETTQHTLQRIQESDSGGLSERYPFSSREQIKERADNFQRIHHTLNALKEFALLQTGRLELNYADEDDLLKLARDVLKEQQYRGDMSSFVVHAEAERLPGSYDQARLKRVLTALFDYVTLCTPPGTLVIVRLRADVTHDALLISLEYEGSKRSKEEQTHLFDLHYWLQQEPSSQNLELALDLYLSSAIITLHGGQISLKQQITEQSNLCISLPRKWKERSTP